MIPREIESKFLELLSQFRVLTLTGPRQAGKTSLVKRLLSKDYRYVSLEDPDMRIFAESDPRGFLQEYRSQVIIDEAQHVPKLFSYIQGIVDETNQPGQYVLTGSQHFLLLENISQSLAGRTAVLHLVGLSLSELRQGGDLKINLEEQLVKGSYPGLYSSKVSSKDWYKSYLRTYVERDLRQIKNIHDLGTFQLFLKMCASRTGQILDLTSIGNDCGISHSTVKSWLNLLEASFIVFLLRPHHRNFGKRLIKAPKIYFYDTGLLCHLLGIDQQDLLTHPLKGGIFESFVIAEFVKSSFNRGEDPKTYFWRDKAGHEVDCLIESQGKLKGIEIKSSKTVASHFFDGLKYWSDLAGDEVEGKYLIYGGDQSQQRTMAQVVPWLEADSIG